MWLGVIISLFLLENFFSKGVIHKRCVRWCGWVSRNIFFRESLSFSNILVIFLYLNSFGLTCCIVTFSVISSFISFVNWKDKSELLNIANLYAINLVINLYVNQSFVTPLRPHSREINLLVYLLSCYYSPNDDLLGAIHSIILHWTLL